MGLLRRHVLGPPRLQRPGGWLPGRMGRQRDKKQGSKDHFSNKGHSLVQVLQFHSLWSEWLCVKPRPLNKPGAVQVKRSPRPIQGAVADDRRRRTLSEGGRHIPLGPSMVPAWCYGVGTVLLRCCTLGYPLGIPLVS